MLSAGGGPEAVSMPLLDRDAGGRQGLFDFGGVCGVVAVGVVVGKVSVATLRAPTDGG